KKLQIQECKFQEVKAANASSGDTDSSGFVSDKGNAKSSENDCSKTWNDQSSDNESSTSGKESSNSQKVSSQSRNETRKSENDTMLMLQISHLLMTQSQWPRLEKGERARNINLILHVYRAKAKSKPEPGL
ncbi:hypothetical protein Tco_1544281, partial [Tanacetum coccineum]